ncbi:MAG: carboxyl-terminal processing protease [Blastocatellia bacterium]|nr:carboxyl-terminal processing protease [Blastocatellia bacterium]
MSLTRGRKQIRTMKRIIALLLIMLAAGSLYAQPAPPPSYQELFNLVWQTINDNFYDPSFGGVDWKSVRQKYSPEVAQVKDDRSFVDLASRMLRELKASHLYLSPGQARRVGIGIRTSRLADQFVITEVAVGSDAARQNVRLGDVLLDPGQLSGPIGTAATVRIKGCDGQSRTLEVKRENPWWPPEHPSLRWHTIEQASRRRIGYIKAGRFDDDAAPLIDAAMEAVKDTYGLIIDLRDGSGGNISCIRLGSYFFQSPQMAVTLANRAFLEKVGSAPDQLDLNKVPRVSGIYTTSGIIDAMKNNGGAAAFYTEDVGPRRYRGKVILLINKETGSASEGFAWMMKGRNSVTLVGETTAGVVLGGEPFNLGGGWTLTVPTHASWGPDGKRYVDTPVTPDVAVKWTRQHVCEQRDPDLAKALDLLDAVR